VKLTKGLRRIVNFLEENEGKIFTQKEIAENLNKSAGTISVQIKKLIDLDMINYQPASGRTPARISLRSGPNGKTQTQSQSQSQTQSQRIKLDTTEAFQEAFEKYNNNYTETETETVNIKTINVDKVKFLKQQNELLNREIDTLKNSLKSSNYEKQALLDTIQNLKTQIETLDKKLTFLWSFNDFAKFMLTNSRKSGSNSYKMGEIAFRRSDLKNIYLIIKELLDQDIFEEFYSED